jgi:2-C-methyl-D-erythritol 4-phosphate cytidylyltransferase/2-C-methyl-D-erythritol 2,4-cyclodiphosphate synthase
MSAGSPVADAIVVAAGASTRMNGLDKLTVPLGERPLLAWSLAAVARSEAVERIVVVVTPERAAEVETAPWLPRKVRSVVDGGPRRQDSVAAGVASLTALGADDRRVVLVHDGARPALETELVTEVVWAADEHGAAIPVLPIAETLKRVADDRVLETVDRAGLAAAQTPQGVRMGLLREAYRRFPPAAEATFTDEAALLEACSIPVHAIRGRPDNLKVTLPADLTQAALILGVAEPRVGFGHDSHPFGPGDPLVLGGVPIPTAPRLHGHSDGDVVLHALADALLGAAGLGDLGRLFPADERTPRGVDSGVLLRDVVARLAERGLRAATVDVTILGARPRLGARLDDIRDTIAALLGVDGDRVNVKGSTGNLAGMEGAGRGISARVVATVLSSR